MATTRATGREPTPVDDEFLHLLYRGGELLAAGKVIEAQDFLERAHKMQPKNEKGQNLLGLTYFKLGLFDRAAELYEQLVRDNPVDPTLRVNLGLVYLKTNALQRAVREFEVAVDLSPEHQKAQNYLGLALAQQGEYGRAREHFLLAGSEAMAEKMSRAIAGEGFSRPAPVQPAKERGFAELEGAEVVREQGGVPVPEVPPNGQAAGDEVSARLAAQVEPPPSIAPVFTVPPSIAPVTIPEASQAKQEEPAAEEDWGAQFEVDEGGELVPEAQAMPEPPAPSVEKGAAASTAPSVQAPQVDDDMAISMVEEVSELTEEEEEEAPPEPAAAEPELPVLPIEEIAEDEMPVLTAEPEEPEDLAARAQYEQATSGDTLVFAEPRAATSPEAQTASVEESTVEPLSVEFTAPGPEVMGPVPVARAVAPGPARVEAWREGEVPVLREFAPAVVLGGASADTPFTVGAGGLTARVEGELLTRLEGLVAFTGPVTFKPEMKRFRGRTTDKPFGDGSARMVRATGRGMLFIEPAEERTFQAVDLGDESAYFRDEFVFAFEEPVMFENGRVPSDVAPDLDLVHLRGDGKVLLSLEGPLRSVPVTMEEAATVPLTHLVGWQGNLTPRVVTLLAGPGGEVLKTAVELSGEGFALISLPVR